MMKTAVVRKKHSAAILCSLVNSQLKIIYLYGYLVHLETQVICGKKSLT